jgi:haloacetate dehalogenase
MFENFEQKRVELETAEINLEQAGDGPPLLLLHGYPQTHAMWHKVAPQLAERFTVVAPDLRGYGDSTGPTDPDTGDYSNRVMAEDMVSVMGMLGFDEYRIAGHDRGARVGYRFALDHPEKVEKLAVLDIVPTLETVERMDYEMAKGMYHWLFLAQPYPVPETLLNNVPAFYVDHLLENWSASAESFDPAAVSEYHRCFGEESVVRASCEDYRAGLSIDLDHDRASRDVGDRIECPLFVLWGDASGTISFDPVEIWEQWATSVSGQALSCGHFVSEEAPNETVRELESFFV